MKAEEKIITILTKLATERRSTIRGDDLVYLIPYLLNTVKKSKSSKVKSILRKVYKIIDRSSLENESVKFLKLLANKDKKAIELFQQILHDVVLKNISDYSKKMIESTDITIEEEKLSETQELEVEI